MFLYFGIMQTTSIPNSFGMNHGWEWVAQTLNSKPMQITPYLLFVFIQCAGFQFVNIYQNQAKKILDAILKVIPTFPSASIANSTRLTVLLESVATNPLKEPTVLIA